jgi:hypothetical protein
LAPHTVSGTVSRWQAAAMNSPNTGPFGTGGSFTSAAGAVQHAGTPIAIST